MKNRFTVPLSLVLLSFVFVFSFSFAQNSAYAKKMGAKAKSGAMMTGEWKRPMSGAFLS